MKLAKIFNVIILVGSCSFVGASDFTILSSDILEEIWNFHPIAATNLGIHKYDTLMPDYSAKELHERLKRFEFLSERLSEVDASALSIEQRVDWSLLKASLYDEIFDLQSSEVYARNPLIYVQSCINGVYTIMIRHAASIQDKMAAIIARLNQIPAFLVSAQENLRQPQALLCEIGINQLTEGERLIEEVFECYSDSLTQGVRVQFQQAKIRAVAAMMQFAYWLEKNQDPNAVYSLGREGYNLKLKNVHLIDMDADSMLKIGEYYLLETVSMIDSLYALLRPSQRQIVELPQDFGPAQVSEYRLRELRDLREFVVASGILTVPEWVGNVMVVQTPDFLRELVPGAAMMPPGPFDQSGTSYFYTPPLPVTFDRIEAEYFYNYIHNHWFRESAVHEAYPGHHVQLSIANNHSSVVRKSHRDYFLVEGWALYCEELIAVSGYDDNDIGAMIKALEGIKYRAARVIVDVKLQTGAFSYEDAVQFMIDTFGGNHTYYSREVKRYISNPIQPSSYLIGKLQLQDLLEDYREERGSEFRLRDFHDELLSHGSIPVKLIRRLMLGA